MQAIVRDRQQGKTTELIKWLLQGKEKTDYPYWSRVIVCAAGHNIVAYTTNMVRKYIEDNNWSPCEHMLSHICTDDTHNAVLADVRKSVWGMSDYLHNEVGTREFEFAVDDMDFAWERGYRILRRPSIITMTGKVYS